MVNERMLDRAIEFATVKHSGISRKGTTIPYITHVIEAMEIVSHITDDEELRAAAVLHDTLEDIDTTKEELVQNFGQRVADLVAAETENKREDQPADSTWIERKQETIRHLAHASTEIRMLALGDKLSNVRAMHRDYQTVGEKLWERFNQKNPIYQGMYYGQLANIFGSDETLRETQAYEEYIKLCSELFSGEYDGDGKLIEEDVMNKTTEKRNLCHIHEIANSVEAHKDLKETTVKEYDTSKLKIDTDKLYKYLNIYYIDPWVNRKLVRCEKCGALLIHQCICDPNIYDGFEYLEDWIPVRSEEEADQLNNLLNATELPIYPARHLQAEDLRCWGWTKGEEPRFYEPNELKEKIQIRCAELEAK